ncbi:MAG: hypothetical protein IBX61_06050 [Thermoleophilia bacterium]|nr:hypothetical protein [Thermoleophilia bacterium]
MFCDRKVLIKEEAPNGDWSLYIYGPVLEEDTNTQPQPHFYASFRHIQKDKYIAVPFGCPAETEQVRVKWGLGERDACLVYIDDDCYVIFNYGTWRFRSRENFRVHPEPPFSADDLAALEKDNRWPD